ncbi:glycine dehydrogenase [bacterium DOLJORAL78_65_58]|nr:MAG: glycine dehydrogenase [bacterium DOLJORAL78_65_58]
MAYVPHTPEDVRAMLEVIGVDSIDDLFAGLPENVRLKEPLAMADGLSEEEVLREFRRAAARNQGLDSLTSFLGGGMYDCAIPAAVDAIAGRSEFLTAYTPYQPEVSQGTLQVIYEWQTFITMRGMGYTVKVAPAGADGRVDVEALAGLMDDGVGTVVVQNPNYLGQIEDVDAIAAVAREHKAHLVAAVNPVSLSVLKIPAEYGASVAVGEAQPFGVPVSWGGPLLGFMACVDKLKRRLPGRVVGATRDNRGQSGYVLTLQTREQHIRREKATSNICSNQGLNALKATVYLSMLGTEGYRELGEANLIRAAALKRAVSAVEGVTLPYPGPVFNEMVLRLSRPAAGFRAFARERGVLAGIDLKDFAVGGENDLLVAVTEKRTAGEIDHLAALLDAYLNDKEVR